MRREVRGLRAQRTAVRVNAMRQQAGTGGKYEVFFWLNPATGLWDVSNALVMRPIIRPRRGHKVPQLQREAMEAMQRALGS